MEDISKLSDEYLFDDFRALFNKGRENGLCGEDRDKYKALCAEMNKRGWLRKDRRYGFEK